VSLVAAPLLAGSTTPAAPQWLQKVAAGQSLLVLAHQERAARYRLAHVETKAEKDAAGQWLVTGRKSIVPAGEHADAYLVPARVSGAVDDPAGIALFLVARGAGVKVHGYPTQDGACASEVEFERASGIEALPAGAAFGAIEAAIDRGIAAVAAEAVGAMDKLFAVTVEYLNTRKQFGVPIGTFQALRHRVADVKMQLELARSMSYFATLKLGEAPEARRRALSQAKVQLGQSMRFLGQQCIQMHGGIGVTDEYIAGHYFKRLTMIELSYGDTLHHLGEVSARMQDTAGVFA
jgi:alkylation response protein AidB-like acyl-CoA dehydrogenase